MEKWDFALLLISKFRKRWHLLPSQIVPSVNWSPSFLKMSFETWEPWCLWPFQVVIPCETDTIFICTSITKYLKGAVCSNSKWCCSRRRLVQYTRHECWESQWYGYTAQVVNHPTGRWSLLFVSWFLYRSSRYPASVNCTGDIRTLLSKEGSMPILPSMNTFIELRQEEEYRNIFHEGTGLISQVQEQLGLDWKGFFKGETWYKFRQAVQKEMMSPSGALHYIKDIEDIALDLTDVMDKKRAEDGRTEVGSLCQQFALESIASIFYGARLRVLKGEKVHFWGLEKVTSTF